MVKYNLIGLAVLLNCSALFSQDYTIPANADSYVSKSTSTQNFGSETSLLIKGSTNGSFDRKSYVKFDLTGSTSNYAQIVLKLVKSGGDDVRLKTYSTATTWDENVINWDNAPDKSKDVNQGDMRQGNILYVDITEYIKQKIDTNQLTVALLLSTDDIVGNPYAVYSKETSTNSQKPSIEFYKIAKFKAVKNITLSNYISSDMVIQRGRPFPFRGEGSIGETITVDFNRKGVVSSASAVVDANGNFNIVIPAMQESDQACTATIKIVGYPDKTVTLTNILIGDVWFAGGQSNMEKRVDYMLEATQMTADADNYPNIRAFRASYNSVFDP